MVTRKASKTAPKAEPVAEPIAEPAPVAAPLTFPHTVVDNWGKPQVFRTQAELDAHLAYLKGN